MSRCACAVHVTCPAQRLLLRAVARVILRAAQVPARGLAIAQGDCAAAAVAAAAAATGGGGGASALMREGAAVARGACLRRHCVCGGDPRLAQAAGRMRVGVDGRA